MHCYSITTGNRLEESQGQVAFMLNTDDKTDRKLETFLRQSRIYRHDDASSFMSELTTMLTSADTDQLVEKSRKRGGVFLSYCSQDRVMASQVFFMLRRQGYNVWMDNDSLYGGDNYNVVDVSLDLIEMEKG